MHKKYHKKFKILDILAVTTQAREGIETIIFMNHGISQCSNNSVASSACPRQKTIAYVIFSLGMVGSPLPIWLFKADFLAQITERGMPADYVAAVEALSSNAILIVLFVAPIIGGIIGAFIARSLFKKHFVKAGIV